MSSKPWPLGGLKHTPACPEQDRSAALWRVMEAEGSAKSASRSDWTGFDRPRMVLSRPISRSRLLVHRSVVVRTPARAWQSRGLAQLGLDTGQLGESLLEGGMGREDGGEADAALGDGRREVEGIEALCRAE